MPNPKNQQHEFQQEESNETNKYKVHQNEQMNAITTLKSGKIINNSYEDKEIVGKRKETFEDLEGVQEKEKLVIVEDEEKDQL